MPTSPAACVRTPFDDAVADSNIALVLESPDESFVIDRDGLRIGSSPVCELPLPGGPPFHSVIHRQSGVTWIESQDDASLIVNGQPRCRMALRDGDVLELNGLELIVRFRSIDAADEPHGLEEDLSLWSAEELCDRILAEQAMIDEFSEGRRAGWSGLLAAIEAECETEQSAVTLPIDTEQAVEPVVAPDNCGRLLEQIRELSEMVNGRSQELDDCESELVAAAALLEEAQGRVSHQIEGLHEQLQTPAAEMELRASA